MRQRGKFNCVIWGMFLMIIISLPIMQEPSNYIGEGNYSTVAEMKSAHICWVYKTIDGVLYKRGYNSQTSKWSTDWIKA